MKTPTNSQLDIAEKHEYGCISKYVGKFHLNVGFAPKKGQSLSLDWAVELRTCLRGSRTLRRIASAERSMAHFAANLPKSLHIDLAHPICLMPVPYCPPSLHGAKETCIVWQL